MRKRLPEVVILALLVIAICTNGVLLLRAKAATHRSRHTPPVVLRLAAHERVSPDFEGFSADGRPIQVLPVTTGAWAFRYVSGNCPFSTSDTYAELLAKELARLGHKVVVTVPSGVEEWVPEPPATGMSTGQTVLVSLNWIRKFRLTGTPTFLLFGRGGELIWYKVGRLNPADITRALSALQRAEGGDATGF